MFLIKLIKTYVLFVVKESTERVKIRSLLFFKKRNFCLQKEILLYIENILLQSNNRTKHHIFQLALVMDKASSQGNKSFFGYQDSHIHISKCDELYDTLLLRKYNTFIKLCTTNNNKLLLTLMFYFPFLINKMYCCFLKFFH